MGGVAGFMGTYLIGPREGLFKWDKKLSFILDDQLQDYSDSDSDSNSLDEASNHHQVIRESYKQSKRQNKLRSPPTKDVTKTSQSFNDSSKIKRHKTKKDGAARDNNDYGSLRKKINISSRANTVDMHQSDN